PKGTNTPFEEHELEFAESVCTITAASIANTTMVAELKQTNRRLDQRLHELNTLLDVAKEFNLLTDRQAIANAFKFTLMGQLFVRTFLLAYKDGEQMHLLASSNLNEKPSESLLRTLFESANDQGDLSDELRQKVPFLHENGITVLSRVLLDSEPRAVIAVGKRGHQKPLTPSDLKFLDSLANLAVLSIQKTFFLEQQIEQQRMEEELNIAASIQQRLLPHPIPTIAGADLAAGSVSSRQVGGDYFDVVELPENRHLLAIGDVTGKGVPASLLMANLQSMLHTIAPLDLSLEKATGQINDQIFKNTPSDKFITFFWGILEPSTGTFKYVNAGHNPPLLLQHGQTDFKELTEGGLLLGAMQTMALYESASLQLHDGDLLVLYTDGVSEAFSPGGDEEYGEERLKEKITALRDRSAQEIFDGIVADVKEFTGGKYSDDITLIVLKNPPEED
ncbi:MAG: PP2C family protein-serine/threonine phosphatase, partial [Balneolaceae bacterium]